MVSGGLVVSTGDVCYSAIAISCWRHCSTKSATNGTAFNGIAPHRAGLCHLAWHRFGRWTTGVPANSCRLFGLTVFVSLVRLHLPCHLWVVLAMLVVAAGVRFVWNDRVVI